MIERRPYPIRERLRRELAALDERMTARGRIIFTAEGADRLLRQRAERVKAKEATAR